MKRYFIYNITVFLLGAIGFSSCSNEENPDAIEQPQEDVRFDLNFGFADALENESLTHEFGNYFKDGVSCVYVSQRAYNLSIDFNLDHGNCYRYIYRQNESASWESGFNFIPYPEALDWGRILDNGQFGQVYAFAILYFPNGDNEGNFPYKVGADQSNVEDFIQWDILGGYHRTGKVRDRLRFQLKQMLCRMKINLYIPIVDVEMGNGYNVTGISAEALSFRTDYALDFGEMDSEGIPAAHPSTDAGVIGSVENIKMKKTYQTEEDYEILTDLQNFKVDLEEDKVKKYTFEMIFPSQTVTGDIFRFKIGMDGQEKSYVFNTNVNLTNQDGYFEFVGGAVTNLELYLPRTDNQILMLEANIQNWDKASADFVITPDADRKNNDNHE